MKKIIPLLIFFGILSLQGQSQIIPHWDWAKDAYGSDFGNYGTIKGSICVDVYGNNYEAGSAKGDTINSGTTLLTNPGSAGQIYVMKRDASGNILWGKSFAAGLYDKCMDIISDNNGNIYITGQFYIPIITFGAFTLINQGSFNMFLVKLDSSGTVLWAKYGASSNSNAQIFSSSVTIDGIGNVIVTGCSTNSPFSFDSYTMPANSGGAGTNNIFLLKLNSSGNVIMSKTFPTGQILPPHITSDANGNIYMAGSYFLTSISFNSFILPAPQSWDVFTVKFNPSGNPLWVTTGGGNMEDYAEDICSDSFGNIYVIGEIDGSGITFDSVILYLHPVCFVKDIFVAKYDSNGNLVFANRMGGSGHDFGYGIGVDGIGNIFLTGIVTCYTNETITFGTNYTFYPPFSFTGGAAFVVKCNPAGNPMWFKYSEGGIGHSIAVSSSDDAYISGTYSFSPIVFGSATLSDTTSNQASLFIAKISECMASSSSITQTTCHPFIFDGHTYDSTGVYVQTLTSASGCDSIVTLNLTMNYKYGSVSVTSCNGYSINNQNYTQSGIYYVTFADSLGCDSIVTLNLTVINPNVSITGVANSLTANSLGANSYQWLDCNNSMTQINGEIDQTYTPNTNGNFAVVINLNGCMDTSLCYSVTNIGIIENQTDNSAFIISPNPFTNSATITLPTTNNQQLTTITITDVLGKEIKTITFTGKECVIEKGDMQRGIYFVQITDENKNVVNRKLVLE